MRKCKLKILVADDELISRMALVSTLKKNGYDVVETQTGTEAVAEMSKKDGPKIAILDWMMPGMTGLDVCKTLRSQDAGDYLYLILLTSKSNVDDVISGLDSGADDYLVKPFNARELRVRLRNAERIIKLEQELIATRDELQIKAIHDALTGLLNRGAIFEFLIAEKQRSSRRNYDLSVIMIDIDNFKSLNDSYGHIAGDYVLREVASRLQNNCRGYDMIGRYGGEEFLVVLPETSHKDACMVAERMRKNLEKDPIITDSVTLNVTASFGVSSKNSIDACSVMEFIKVADKGLYEAKANGKNCVRFIA